MYPNNEKLAMLAEAEGFDTIDEMLETASFDGVAPAICTEPCCDHMGYQEPDGDCVCPRCEKGNTVKSCLMLAEVI